MEGFDFAAAVRVRFAETDAQGVAHHANYLVWFEVARVEFLEKFAGGYQRLRDQGIESLLVEAHARFIVPAVIDRDPVLVTQQSDVAGLSHHSVQAIEFCLSGQNDIFDRFDGAAECALREDPWTLAALRIDMVAFRAAPPRARNRFYFDARGFALRGFAVNYRSNGFYVMRRRHAADHGPVR